MIKFVLSLKTALKMITKRQKNKHLQSAISLKVQLKTRIKNSVIKTSRKPSQNILRLYMKLSSWIKDISMENSAFQKAFQQVACTKPTEETKVCLMEDQLRHKPARTVSMRIFQCEEFTQKWPCARPTYQELVNQVMQIRPLLQQVPKPRISGKGASTTWPNITL